MGTRAVYTFTKGNEEFHVYKHYDGYPEGASQFLMAALNKAWGLPRFEPDEFAAAFIAANKEDAGDIRLMPSGPIEDIAPADIEYHYIVSQAPNGQLIVKANSMNCWEGFSIVGQVFYGRLKDFYKAYHSEAKEAA